MNTEDYASWVYGKMDHECEVGPGGIRRCAKPVDHVISDEFAEFLRDDDFVGAVNGVLREAGQLLIRKHHDYGPKNISLSPGGALNGLRVRIHDKVARINNLIDSGAEPENESLRDSWVDLLNYSAIALLVIDGKWPE